MKVQTRDAPSLAHALQQLPQRHLGRAGNLDGLARLGALVEGGPLRRPRHIPPRIGPAHVAEVAPCLADMQLIVVVGVGAVVTCRRARAHDALLLATRRARAAALRLRPGHAALGLPPGDAAAQLADLVDQVDAVGRLGVLGPDVQVEVAAEARRGEVLPAERTALVLGRFELRFGGGAGRRVLRSFAHGVETLGAVLKRGHGYRYRMVAAGIMAARKMHDRKRAADDPINFDIRAWRKAAPNKRPGSGAERRDARASDALSSVLRGNQRRILNFARIQHHDNNCRLSLCRLCFPQLRRRSCRNFAVLLHAAVQFLQLPLGYAEHASYNPCLVGL
jgi:hypothetical protein